MHFLDGNAVKYLYRYAKKARPAQDIEKAIFYLEAIETPHIYTDSIAHEIGAEYDTYAKHLAPDDPQRITSRIICMLRTTQTEHAIAEAVSQLRTLVPTLTTHLN